MVYISNFTSVFEVSIALHLAYSLVTNLHNLQLKKVQDREDAVIRVMEQLVERKELSETDVALINMGLISNLVDLVNKIRPFEVYIRYFVATSVIVAIDSLVWLIWFGFNPHLSISYVAMSILLAVSVLPMPLFMLVTWLVMRKKTIPLHKTLDDIADRYFKKYM